MILKVFFSLLIFSILEDISTEGTKCLPNLKNLAVYEGDQNIIMNVIADPQLVEWTTIPTSDEFGSYDKNIILNLTVDTRIVEWILDWTMVPTSDEFGTYSITDPLLTGLFIFNPSGLLVLEATTTPTKRLISTSGLYIAQCANKGNMTAAKLLVVRYAPECSCNASSPTYVQLSCTIRYADGTLHPIYANMTWKIGDVVYTTDAPYRKRIDYYVFESRSTITVDSSVSKNFTCTVTFNKPTDIEYEFIAKNEPEFNASCSVEVCSVPTTSGTTDTTAPPPTTATLPPTTTTETPSTTTATTQTHSTTTATTLTPSTTTATTQTPSTTTSTTQTPSTTSQLPKRTTPLKATTKPPLINIQPPDSTTERLTKTQQSTTTSIFDLPTITSKRYTKILSTTILPPTKFTAPSTTECNCPLSTACPPPDNNCKKIGECQPDGTNLTEGIYASGVVKAELYARYDKCCPKDLVWGVVVTLSNNSRWLIHDPLCNDNKCEMVVVSASCMSSEWTSLADREITISGVGDYLQTGNSVQIGVNMIDCNESCQRMMNLS